MKPKKKGKARTELATNIRDLLLLLPADLSELRARESKLVAAILGGAIDQALEDMGHDKGLREIFWRYANENCWRMTRSLRASGQLDKIQ